MGDITLYNVVLEFAAKLLVAWFESESFMVFAHHALHSILPFIN